MQEHEAGVWDYVINYWIVWAIVIGLAALASRSRNKVPTKTWGLQNVAEQVVEAMQYMTVSVVGEAGRKYTVFIGSIFIFVLSCNVWGNLSFLSGFTSRAGFMVASPSASLSTNIALALIVFFYVQWEGIKAQGIWGYIKHFMGPIAFLYPIMFVLEVISALIKPVSMSLRLYGNIFGEDKIIAVLANMGRPVWLPVQFPMLLFGLFTSVVQALVFTMLTAISLALITEKHEDHGHDHAHDTHDTGLVDKLMSAADIHQEENVPIPAMQVK